MDLQQAKEKLRANWHKGVKCDCCGQFVKLYKRKLNSGMAIALINIYKYHGRKAVNVKDFLREERLPNNHDWTLLKHWGFIREIESKEIPSEKKSNGVWRITVLGEKFLKNNLPKCPSHILIYNNTFQGFSSSYTTIIKALGNKFNYEELMNNYGN